MKELGFGIVGCGAISKWHADSIRKIDGCKLVAASDVSPANRKKFEEIYGVPVLESASELFARPDIDIVCICTPSGLHAPLCIQAADAGKHVVTEKPMALTVKDCDDIIAAAERNNVKICVISQLRFSHSVRSVKTAVENGTLGRIVTGDVYMKYHRSADYYASSPWRGTWKMDGGGALMNQGIHGVDTLLNIMGPVKSVFGNCRTLLHSIETEDTASAVLEFKNGALGIIQATTSVSPGSARRIEICGSKGTIVMFEDSVVEWSVEGASIPADILITSSKKSGFADPANIGDDGHFEQLSDMAEAVRNNRAPAVDCYEGRKPVELICAIYESSRTGKRIDIGE